MRHSNLPLLLRKEVGRRLRRRVRRRRGPLLWRKIVVHVVDRNVIVCDVLHHLLHNGRRHGPVVFHLLWRSVSNAISIPVGGSMISGENVA
jgi:hypothetical protein